MGTSGAVRRRWPTMHEVATHPSSESVAAAPPIIRNTETRLWQQSARCRGTDPAILFHPDGERGLERRDREQNAKRFCAPCPVRMQCFEYSLRFEEPYGIWGGISEDERHRILATRPRAAAARNGELASKRR